MLRNFLRCDLCSSCSTDFICFSPLLHPPRVAGEERGGFELPERLNGLNQAPDDNLKNYDCNAVLTAACKMFSPCFKSAPRCTRSARRLRVSKHLEVAARLSRFDDPKGVLLSWHRQISRIITGDLQEDAGISFRPLIGLPGRVQEPWAESEASGDFFIVAHGIPNRLQLPIVRLVHLDVTKNGKVIAGLEDDRDAPSHNQPAFDYRRAASLRAAAFFSSV